MNKNSTTERNKILKLFKKHCIKCDGLCCKKAEFTVFSQELSRLVKRNKELIFRKYKSSKESDNIKRINMKGGCPFLKNNGCELGVLGKPLDCFTYPIYPIIKYYKIEKKEMIGMMIHKSCPFSNEISKNKKLIKLLFYFWQKELNGLSKENIRDWFGDKRNYWLDKNLIKVKV